MPYALCLMPYASCLMPHPPPGLPLEGGGNFFGDSCISSLRIPGQSRSSLFTHFVTRSLVHSFTLRSFTHSPFARSLFTLHSFTLHSFAVRSFVLHSSLIHPSFLHSFAPSLLPLHSSTQYTSCTP